MHGAGVTVTGGAPTGPATRRSAVARLGMVAVLFCVAAPRSLPAQTVTPDAQDRPTPHWFRWGWQRTDLLRYNRVEGASVGARAQAYPETALGPVSVGATVRLGSADRVVNLRVDLSRETLGGRLAIAGFRELAAVEEGTRPLGLVNSMTALVGGRDDGDYYRRSGVALTWTPPSARRQSFLVRAWAERHQAVEASTHFALARVADDGWRFRPNLTAAEGWDVGAALTLSPWWGSDPREAQGGLEGTLRVAEGAWSYRTLALTGCAEIPLAERVRVALAVGGGSSWGTPPPQRRFAVGGSGSLRGFDPYTLSGPDLLRGRVTVSRRWAFGVVSAFSDAAWAGEASAFALSRVLASAGAGVAIADGRIHADAAWGVRGPASFRLELYLDGAR